MKRTLSLVLALVMVLGSFSTVFAAGTSVEETAGAFLKDKEVLVGNAEGNLMLGEGLKRQDAVILLSKLMGEFDEASTEEGIPTYKDIRDNFYLPFLAWAQANGTFVGHNDAKFGFGEFLTAQEYASVLLRVLGYEVEWKETLAKATELGLLAEVEVENSTKITRGQMAVMTVNALETEMKDSEETLAEKLEIEMPQPAKLEVKDIKANTAKSFQVTFNKAVADDDNLKYEVTRGATKLVVTPEYAEDKLSVELKSTTTFANGDYTVKVLSNDVELDNKVIAIAAQKLAKIEITSTVLSVTNDSTGKQYGYATYVAYDQYGVDVTNSYLAQNITFLSGAGDVTKKDGILTVDPSTNVNLIALPTVAISGYDTNSGVTVTANLTPAVAVGTLKTFELLPAETVTVVAGDTTTIHYIPYKAVDMSGNETKSLKIVKDGLILGTNDSITVTNSWVNASVVEDPKNPGQAAIKVVADTNTPGDFNMDLPFNITAMTKTGSVSTIAGVLKPAPSIQTITLYAPAQVVAAGDDYAVIPYEAYDKLGNKLTRTSQINPSVTLGLSTTSVDGLYYTTLVDGTMELRGVVPATKGPKMYNVSVKNTGHFSNITISVQDPAKADSLSVSLVSRALEVNSTVKVGFGYLNEWPPFGGLSVKDNYGRDVDMVLGGKTYVVEVSKQNPSSTVLTAVDVDGNAVDLGTGYSIGAGKDGITIKAASKGSETLVFRLLDGTTEVARRTHTFTVVNTDEIVSYTVTPVASTIYTGDSKYGTGFTVRGKTLSGTEVQLVGAAVSAKPANTVDFVSAGSAVYAKASGAGYVAKSTDTNVNVTVIHGNNVAMLDTKVSSTTVAPVAKSIDFDISHDEALATNHSFVNDVLTLKAGQFSSVTHITADDNTGITTDGFSVTDSYNKSGTVANYYVSELNASGIKSIKIDQDGKFEIKLTDDSTGAFSDLASGATFKITAVTNNGLVKTIKVVIQ